MAARVRASIVPGSAAVMWMVGCVVHGIPVRSICPGCSVPVVFRLGSLNLSANVKRPPGQAAFV
jgi:hypothetical protein